MAVGHTLKRWELDEIIAQMNQHEFERFLALSIESSLGSESVALADARKQPFDLSLLKRDVIMQLK